MSDEWSTPKPIFNPLNHEFRFELDACASHWNHKCANYFTVYDNALEKDWSEYGSVWMNPPYGREIERWIKKAWDESIKGCIVVCLIPARTETSWFHDYCLKGEIRFMRGRIHFADINGNSGRPRFGNAVVIFRPMFSAK